MNSPDRPKRRKRKLLGAAAGVAALGALVIATQSGGKKNDPEVVPQAPGAADPAPDAPGCAPVEAVKGLSMKIGGKVLRASKTQERVQPPSSDVRVNPITDWEAALSLLREVQDALQETFPSFKFIRSRNDAGEPEMTIDDTELEGCRYVGEITGDPSRGLVDLHYAHSSLYLVVDVSGVEPFQVVELMEGLQGHVNEYLERAREAYEKNPNASSLELDMACRRRVKDFLLQGGYEFAMKE